MATETTLSKTNPTILIVDDAPANLDLLAEMLQERGFEPRPVPSGRLALAAVQAEPPDLILLDIRMPEMDGFKVYESLRADEISKDIPVIFITALSETAEKVKAFSMGAVDYVTKPFHVDEIEARVRTHLRIRALQQQLHVQNENLEKVVVERTRELAEANKQLLASGQLKDDFLRMISYEIRTPVNGVLGLGDLIIDLCPPSEDIKIYSDHFKTSSLRLRSLIEDATLITDIEKMISKEEKTISFTALLNRVRTSLPEIGILTNPPCEDAKETISLQGAPGLLRRALESIILLAASFSKNQHAVRGTCAADGEFLCMKIDLDALAITQEALTRFFEIESPSRAETTAEPLGLAPVVAHKIITTFGGNMRLVKGERNSGWLEVSFLTVPARDKTA